MDLAIDLSPSSPTYGDLVLANGDVLLTSDGNPNGPNYVRQNVMQRLRFFSGEWFLNTSLGVPFYQQILRSGANKGAVDALLQGVIVATPGVLRLTSWTSTVVTAQRVVKIAFTAQATSGTFSYAGPLNTPTSQVSQ